MALIERWIYSCRSFGISLPSPRLMPSISASPPYHPKCPFSIFENEKKRKSPLTEVSDLHALTVSDDGVDGEMGVYEPHLVLEALGNTGNHVGDHGLDGSEAGNVLSGTVPHGESDSLVLLGLDLWGRIKGLRRAERNRICNL